MNEEDHEETCCQAERDYSETRCKHEKCLYDDIVCTLTGRSCRMRGCGKFEEKRDEEN